MNTLLKYLKNVLLSSIFCIFAVGCSASNIITTPTRVVADIASIIPVVGDEIEEGLDKGADIIDIIYK